ncbi:hypothetical protein [Streptomyces cyaneus]|uniref:hypothetical protein n=1 Tax=Streptomyces cyaneus TaxID=1904 RepID=UPI0013E308F5|nr:hypothetical protein [Streptomyces cyaneus]
MVTDAGHTEVLLTAQGSVLIRIGPRPAGGTRQLVPAARRALRATKDATPCTVTTP